MSKDFENKAKSLGDDFKLQPRENVWMRIEEALDEKTHRRIAWWWWAAPVVLLLGSGIWYIASHQTGNNNAPATLSATSTKNTRPAQNGNIFDADKSDNAVSPQPTVTTVEPAPAAIQKENYTNRHVASGQHYSSGISKNHNHTNIQHENNSSSNGLDQHISQTPSTTRTPSNPEDQAIPSTAGADVQASSPERLQSSPINKGAAVTGQEIAVSPQREQGLESTKTPGLTVPQKTEETVILQPAAGIKEDSSIVESHEASSLPIQSGVTENNSKKKATWLLQTGLGMSNMGDLNLLPIGGQKSADQLQNSMNPSVVVPTASRSDKAGPSVSVGLQRKQTLSKRWQWSASLAWQYQQIQQYKGVKIDSVIRVNSAGSNFSNSYFYTPGSNTSEKGINHRIILSNELSWQVLKNQPWLRVGAGLYAGYNIASNYYVEDYMQRLIKNDGLYSKAFLGLTPSLQFELKNNIRINLNTRIDFTKAYKELNGNPTYWRGWEVRADFPIFTK